MVKKVILIALIRLSLTCRKASRDPSAIRYFRRNAPGCPDPRFRRTGVALTINTATERDLGFSKETLPTLLPLCDDSVPFYRCLL